MTVANLRRRLSAGVELQPRGTAHVRVWAPACRVVEIVLESRGRSPRATALERDNEGFHEALIEDVQPGDRYWYRLDRDRLRPDPVSRFQPEGPHGPSEIVDPSTFSWSDAEWRGIDPHGQVAYEIHVGTFTPAGTWISAAAEIEELARLGVTVIEMMPVADFAGRFGWGYDGVNLYAPTRLYGVPDDLRAFVDKAHTIGIAVILDVVYNHFGPDGNYLSEFSRDYFTDKYKNDWGQAINFEGPRPARDFFVENAGYWIDEFHFDGLRLDATQDIHDASADHVIASIVERARQSAAGRRTYIVAENEPQDTRIVRPRQAGGYGADALWNDDYHHTALVALTGRREAYYTDYTGTPQELVSCSKYGYLYQGQWYSWQKQRRGSPGLDLKPCSFVAYLENHDQVANTPFGRRLHQMTSPARHRAMTALTLLGPATPLLFQGQEFSASAPFLYFADHREELRESIRNGRREFLAQFPSVLDPEVAAALPPPSDEATYQRCKLDLSEREAHAEAYAIHRDLLAIRRDDPVIRAAGTRRVDGAVLASEAFLLRYQGADHGDRLLVVNLGCDLDLTPLPEPLLAPPAACRWELQWSSESVRYGGQGTPPLNLDSFWHFTGESAILLRSVTRGSDPEPNHDD
jgi:maltooligosyltrehalose trehalohydrolase